MRSVLQSVEGRFLRAGEAGEMVNGPNGCFSPGRTNTLNSYYERSFIPSRLSVVE